MFVFLNTDRNSPSIDKITFELEKLGVESFTLDDFLFKKTNFHFDGADFIINGNINFKDCISVFTRNLSLDFKEKLENSLNSRNENQFNFQQNFDVLKGFLSSAAAFYNIPIINQNSNLNISDNKLYHKFAADNAGMLMPPFIVSNDKNKILEFAKKYKKLIIKPILNKAFVSQKDGDLISSIGVESELFYEKEIIENQASLDKIPLIYQQYIEKGYEIRVTLIGSHIIACKIDNQKSGNEISSIDWKRDLMNIDHFLYQLPLEIEQKLLKIMKYLKLTFGTIDLIKSPGGRYYFLEANSNGQWGWVEDKIGVNISEKIAIFLAKSF